MNRFKFDRLNYLIHILLSISIPFYLFVFLRLYFRISFRARLDVCSS